MNNQYDMQDYSIYQPANNAGWNNQQGNVQGNTMPPQTTNNAEYHNNNMVPGNNMMISSDNMQQGSRNNYIPPPDIRNLMPRDTMNFPMPQMNRGCNSLTPETLTNTDFWPAFLKQYIGNWVRVDFFIGNTNEQRVGILQDVGASYIVLNIIEPNTILICDLFTIKFVTVIFDSNYSKLML